MSRFGYGYGYGYGGYAPYVSVADRIALGRAAAKKLAEKEKRSPAPVSLTGKKIAKTFWGLKWCENLESYRDYENRLPRGARYVRNGSVADLVIEPGQVRAIVGGSEAYTIKIQIQPLSPSAWKAISQDCAREIGSLFDLLQGKFSDGVMARLTRSEDGLFPRPSEIKMSCSCPDSAGVCKHIAATMYGVGSRLDTRPELLFTLRKVDHIELISSATSSANLEQSLGVTGMTLSDSELTDIFGIEMEPTTDKPAARKPARAASTKVLAKATLAKATLAKKGSKRVASKSVDVAPQVVVTPAVKKRGSASKTVAVNATVRATVNATNIEPVKSTRRKSSTGKAESTTAVVTGQTSKQAAKLKKPRAAKIPTKPARARRTK
jgi:uncharacterized Zn finger protein